MPSPRRADFSATSVNWGDGSGATTAGITIVALGGGKFSVEGTHTYATPGTYPITVNIVSAGGSKVTTNSTALVADVPVSAPSAVTVTPPGGETVVAGDRAEQRSGRDLHRPVQRPAQLLQRHDRLGRPDRDHAAAPSPVIPWSRGSIDVYGTHTYTQAGNFTITVDITDGGGGSASVTSPVQVVAAPLVDPAGEDQPRRGGKHLHHGRRHVHRPEPVRHRQRFHVDDQLGQRHRQRGPDRRRDRRIQRPRHQHLFAVERAGPGSTRSRSRSSTRTPPIPMWSTTPSRSRMRPSRRRDRPSAPSRERPSMAWSPPSSTATPWRPATNFSASIAWGDGNTSAGTIQAQGGGSFTVSGTNTYANPGNYPITVSISDVGGASATAVSTGSRCRRGPDAAGSNTGFSAFQGTTFSGGVVEFTDADPNAPAGSFTATINWGNGNITPGSVLQLGGGLFQVAGSNTYAQSGSFPVTVTITSVGGSSLILNTTAQVLAPLQGSTGNGGFTNNTQPTFSGTAQPGAVISLFVTSTNGSGVAATGRAVVNASGPLERPGQPGPGQRHLRRDRDPVTSTGVAATAGQPGDGADRYPGADRRRRHPHPRDASASRHLPGHRQRHESRLPGQRGQLRPEHRRERQTAQLRRRRPPDHRRSRQQPDDRDHHLQPREKAPDRHLRGDPQRRRA